MEPENNNLATPTSKTPESPTPSTIAPGMESSVISPQERPGLDFNNNPPADVIVSPIMEPTEITTTVEQASEVIATEQPVPASYDPAQSAQSMSPMPQMAQPMQDQPMAQMQQMPPDLQNPQYAAQPQMGTNPESTTTTKPRSKTTLIISIIAAVVLVITIIVVALVASGALDKILGGSKPTPTPAPSIITPNAELAQSTCEEYGGTFTTMEANPDTQTPEFSSIYTCNYDYALPPTNVDGFNFTFVLLDRDFTEVDYLKITDDTAAAGITVLENSDNMIKTYYTTDAGDGATRYTYEVAYSDTYIELNTFDAGWAESLLSELGYPTDVTQSAEPVTEEVTE